MAELGAEDGEQGHKKRKQSGDASNIAKTRTKKPRSDKPLPKPQPGGSGIHLLQPHEATLSELEPKYNILAASVISSSQIRKRVSSITRHLVAAPEETSASPVPRSRIALLHSRPADVCKLITITEQCKRVLKEEGKAWYQYNQLFDLPPRAEKPETVDETVLVDKEQDSSDDEFEVMQDRIKKATLPPPRTHTPKSLRIVLSCVPIPELKAQANVTLQCGEAAKPIS